MKVCTSILPMFRKSTERPTQSHFVFESHLNCCQYWVGVVIMGLYGILSE